MALLILAFTAVGCRKKSDTDEAADLGASDIPDLIVSGDQPVSGTPDAAVKTGKDGKGKVTLTPSDDGGDADGGDEGAGGGDPADQLNWASLIDDFSVAEDAAMNETVVAPELDDAVFSIIADESDCDDGAWNPNVFIDGTTGELSGTPTNADVGTCELTIRGQGSNGYVKGTLNVTVTNTADAPTWFQEPGNLSVADGRNLVGQWIASDVDAGASISYSLDLAAMTCDDGNWSPEISINALNGVLSGVPAPSDRGTCTLVVRATSGGTTISSGPHTITVSDLPDALTWSGTIGNQSINEDSSLSVSADAVDTDDGAVISYALDLGAMTCDNGSWSGLSINSSTGDITGTPTNGDVGSCTIRVVATSGGDSINQSFTVTVSNTNDAPTWNPSLADFSQVRDSGISRTAVAQDVDSGATIAYSFDLAGMTCDDASPAWPTPIAINSSSGAITGTPAFANIGDCTIRIRAVSGADTIYDDVTISVVDTSNPPTWDATISDLNVNEDSALSVTADATDTDNAVSYSLDAVGTTCDDDGSWNPSLAVNPSTGAITGTPRNASVGACNVRVVASGGGVDINDTFQVTVVNTDDAPTWVQSIGNFSMNEDAAISKTAVATDMDPGASIAYSLDFANMTCDTAGWSPQIGIHSSTGVLSGTPVNPGSCTVRVVATSNSVSITENFTITILDVTGPTLTITPTQSSPTNASTINYTITFNESVTGFVLGDITVVGGTKGNFAGSGTTYTFDVTSPTATVEVSVAGGVAQDAASNGNSASSTSYVATLQTINVDATLASIQVGNNQQYSASGVYSDSSTASLDGLVTWSSTNAAAATVSGSGVATGVAAGSTNVTATLGSKSGFKALTVNAATLVSISVTPVGATTGIGGTLQFSATGTYSNSTTQDVTESVTWTSGTPGTATISNTAGTKGLATAVAAGTSTITAQQGAVSGTRTFTVTSATLDRIEVTPAYASGPAGVTQQFLATAIFTNGTFTDVTTSVNWASDDTGVMTISNTAGSEGRATLVAAGIATITASMGGEDGTVDFTVTGPTLVSIAVTPANIDMPIGLSQKYKATGTYSDSSTRDITNDVSWTSTNGSAATVSNAAGQKGVVSGVASGATNIRATLGAVNNQTGLDVTTATLSSVAVSPSTIMLSQLVGKQFAATATFSDATTLDVTSVVNWTSSNTAVGTMGNSNNDKGYFYNLHNSATTPSITVTANLNGTTGTANVVVTQGALTGMHINPVTATINAGQTQQFQAFGQYNDGASLDVTEFVTWTTSNAAVAVPSNAPGYHGKVIGNSAGSATITATLNGISDTSAVTVSGGAPATTEEGVGLTGAYWTHPAGAGAGAKFGTLKGTRVDSTVNFYWGTGNSPLDVGDYFAVRWTGKVLIPSSGTYSFCTDSDDGVRLWIGGTQRINNWTDHAVVENCATGIVLTGGTKYDVVLEFYENGGFAEIELKWEKTAGGGTFGKQTIPRASLFPN
jgi:hypothetical protein